MSNIVASTKEPKKIAENASVANAYPTLLTALQDMSTFYGVELIGSYVKPTAALSGDTFKGSFHVKP